MVKLHSGPIHFLVTAGQYLVSGGADGHIRFFDFNFRVVAWFEDLDAGPVSSISFAHQPSAFKSAPDAELACPDFVIGTTNALIVACNAAMFGELEPDARRGTLLVQGQDAAVRLRIPTQTASAFDSLVLTPATSPCLTPTLDQTRADSSVSRPSLR